MPIIKVIKSGNCTIEISDDYCKNITSKERKERLENIGNIYYNGWKEGKLKSEKSSN